MTIAIYPFNKPVIILAAPRSGSTLLFELLSGSKDLWTIGDESHAVFETIAKFNPASGLCKSNRLDAKDADKNSINIIRQQFLSQIRNRDGVQYNAGSDKPRLLEKTPKNALRIPFLNSVFPDAYYVFLYRNPRENISSIMDAWNSQYFVTYPQLKGRSTSWSLLLPPDWETMNNKALEEIAYFQWDSANSIILDDLQALIPKDRWISVSYTNIIKNTEETLKALSAFCEFEFDSELQATCRKKLKLSRYTLSQPSPTKWHKHARELEIVLPSTESMLKRLRKASLVPLDVDFDIQIPGNLVEPSKTSPDWIMSSNSNAKMPSRNTPCPCGSGMKYKQCHGKI